MKLFIYGTLKRGESNNRILDGEYLYDAILPGCLIDLGCVPGMLPHETSRVLGEVWDVENVGRLDRFETGYRRVQYKDLWFYMAPDFYGFPPVPKNVLFNFKEGRLCVL